MKTGRVKKYVFILIWFLSYLFISKAEMVNYCVVPPTIGYSVSPNIMLVLQDDGRMRWRAYCRDDDGDGYCDNTYDPTREDYDGYFEKGALYRWNPTGLYWEKTTSGTPTTCPETNEKYPIEYKENKTVAGTNYELEYSVLRGSLKIYNIDFGSGNVTVYDDGTGYLRRSDTNNIVGEIVYSNSSGVGEINFYTAPSSDFEVYYGYNLNTNLIYTGECLNYHFMTRIDIVRYILTGGSPRSCPTSYIGIISNAIPSICDPRQNTVDKSADGTEIILKTQDFEDWDLRWAKSICWDSTCIKNYTFPGIPVKVELSRVFNGILYKQAELKNIGKAKPRIGLITYDTAWPVIHNNKVYIGDFRTSITDYNKNYEYQHVITSINANRDLLPWIPTSTCKTAGIWDAGNSMAPALWDVYRYFSQETPLYCGLDPSTSSEDKWKNPLYQCINFDNSGNCTEVAPAPCSKNFVILITEGMWNIGSDSDGDLIKTCKITDGFEEYASDPVVPIYWLHKKGMVNEDKTIYIDKVYVLNIWPYSIYGEMASKVMAIFGGFDTEKEDWPTGYSYYPQDTCDLSAYNSAFTSCKGSLCVNTIPTTGKRTWDLNNDGIPDTYFKVETTAELRKALETAFLDIQRNASSSSTATLLTGRNDKGAILEQVVFYPIKIFGDNMEISWISQVFTFWYYKINNIENIREDTNGNYKLDILDDKVVQYYLDENQKLVVKVCDANFDGSASDVCYEYTDINAINYLVEPGIELSNKNYFDRKIYAVDENGELRLFNEANKEYFDTLIGTDRNEFPTCLKNNDGSINYENTIKYLLGEQIEGCRNKVIDNTGKTWKLADIMHSTPQIVSYEDYDVVFTASNDGILHAFKIGKYQTLSSSSQLAELIGENKGEELWGFIPKNALPYIRYLADPNYCHIYITDLKPYVFDADYDGDNEKEKVLIGGFRLGGGCGCTDYNCITPPVDTCTDPTSPSCVGLSSYYALDITDPENPVYLWEFTHPELYFTYSGPGIVKTKDNKYHIVFASGPINYSAQYDDNTQDNITLKIFVISLENGNLERIIDTGIVKAFSGRIFSNGFDFDEDGYTDYLAFGYVRQDGANTNFKGGVIILGGRKEDPKLYTFDTDVNNWDFQNFTTFGTDINPVVGKIEFMQCFHRWYMYFGTGRWFTNIDDWEVNRNALFGIPLKFGRDTSGDIYMEVITTTVDMTEPSNESICLDAQNGVIRGWYVQLEDSSPDNLKEKAITDPIPTIKNMIFFTTIEPVKDICGLGGKSRVWGLNCATGGIITGCTVNNYYRINPSAVDGSLLLQLSGGNIEQVKLNEILQTTTSRTTEWYTGLAPEGAPPLVGSYKEGGVLLWLEK